MKQKIFLSVLALTLAGSVAWATVSSVSAQTSSPTWVQTLAQKLGVGEDKVQSALDDMRSQRQAEMQTRLEERLTEAVQSGKITEAQKQAVLARHQAMQQERATERTEWQAWLKSNGLDTVDLGLGFGGHMNMGRGMHGW